MDLLTIVLVILTAAVFFLIGRALAARDYARRLERELPAEREDAIRRSRAVIGGQFSEQLAPYMPGFKYRPTEAKFLGKPTDFIVFEGLDGKAITRVVFVEVKSGRSKLSGTEKSLKEAIGSGKVAFETYEVPEGITR